MRVAAQCVRLVGQRQCSFEEGALEVEVATMFGDPAHEASDVDSLRRCHRRRASSLEERLGRADVVDTQERLAEHQERVARSIDRGRVPELDRRTERPRSCARRAGREERLTGVPQMLGRSFGLTGGLEVAGEHLAVLHHPLARRRLEPLRSARRAASDGRGGGRSRR